MFKALIKKKLQEFRAAKAPRAFPLLLLVSLAPLVGLWFGTPAAIFLSLLSVFLGCCFLGPMCALMAFQGDFAKEANRFLEYLPVRRSSVWLVSYLSGLAVLGLATISLLWLVVLLLPLGVNLLDMGGHSLRPDLQFNYLVPNRVALVVSCGSLVFLAFSVAVFPAAYVDKKHEQAGLAFLLMLPGSLSLPFAIIATLNALYVLPSGLALSGVLLPTALLFSAGSYALFALVPKHITPAKYGLLGIGLFLAIYGVLLGQLYLKHFTWRALDLSQPFQVYHVYKPHLEGKPDLILANVYSYRSGEHCISIDVEHPAYRDLGRGLTFFKVPENDTGLLHFRYSPYPGIESSRDTHFAILSPDAKGKRSFEIPCDPSYGPRDLRWLPDRRVLVYKAYFKEEETLYLCVADAAGTLIKRFEVAGGEFLVNAAGQALVLGPTETDGDGSARETSASAEKPYMIVDLDSDSSDRFRLPGNVVCFAKDLSRVLCSRTRVEDGRQYDSYVVVELSSLEERLVLPEAEFPPRLVTEQVDVRVRASITAAVGDRYSFLNINDAFDTALWLKQRVDGDHFRYSIEVIDLDTAERAVAVPESATPTMPVVGTGGAASAPIALHSFTADGAGFTYAMGRQTYLCEIETRESILLADHGIPVDAAQSESRTSAAGGPGFAIDYSPSYSPSGRRVLRYANVLQPSSSDPPEPRWKFAAVEVFESGKPVRIYTGRRPIADALWLDDRRIVFYEDAAIYVLHSAGGPARQIFPPAGSANSE